MLLRNLDQSAGLCNGTRLIITKMGRYALEGKVITDSNIGDKVYIPRLTLAPSDTRIPFKFQRRQFPISVCFAMTITKPSCCVPSSTRVLSWLTLCRNIQSDLQEWFENFNDR